MLRVVVVVPSPHSFPFSSRRGPWPQPSPIDPTGYWPAVLHIPPRELAEFARVVGGVYARTLASDIPKAFVYAARTQYPAIATDEEITQFLFDGSMCRLLCPTFDPPDLEAFAADLNGAGEGDVHYKSDLSAVARIKPLPGTYCAPTVALFRVSRAGKRTLLAIKVNDLVLRPQDGEAWKLAKLFFMLAASTHMVICKHVPLHFPFDSINAITKSVLSATHPVAQLLRPHFQFSLALSDAALHNPVSLSTQNQLFPYTTLTCDSASTFELMKTSYLGITGNSSYLPYQFVPAPPRVVGDYGVFLDAYYEVFLRLGRKVGAEVHAGDRELMEWANEISHWIRGFPKGPDLEDRDLLARVLAFIVWSVTVAHAADHHDLGTVPLAKVPMRLRVPPPTSRHVPLLDLRAIASREDAFRHRLAWAMFFRDTPKTFLVDVNYGFTSPGLNDAAAAMQIELRELDDHLPTRPYIKLDEIPVSIQY